MHIHHACYYLTLSNITIHAVIRVKQLSIFFGMHKSKSDIISYENILNEYFVHIICTYSITN